MSEEETINWLQSYLEYPEMDNPEYIKQAIQSLINLYNKEKEKREIAEENHKGLSLDLGQALKELGLYEDTIIADELVSEINKRYVSKDKIKEKMQQDIYTNEHTILGGRRHGKTLEYGIRLGRIQMCEELLEERK